MTLTEPPSSSCPEQSSQSLYWTLIMLLDRLDRGDFPPASVIEWGSPVPSFGDLSKAEVATLAINPSNREFVDENGRELEGSRRRFHTLASLGLDSWGDVDARHLDLILDTGREYFSWNPYSAWFKKLDFILGGLNVSFFSGPRLACHLDLVPYATLRKWGEITVNDQLSLLSAARDSLALLLRDSAIRLLILNGSSVVQRFQDLARIQLESRAIPSWSLARQSQQEVPGVAYRGFVDALDGFSLDHQILVLGFNHNLQSSYGISNVVMQSIRNWLAEAGRKAFE